MQSSEDSDIISNLFYEADDHIQEDPQKAIKLFEQCIKLEGDLNKAVNRCFKSAAKIMQIAIKSQDTTTIRAQLERLTEFASKVSTDDAINTLNQIVDDVVASYFDCNFVLNSIFEACTKKFRAQQEIVWHKVSIRICKVFLDRLEYKHMNLILDSLKYTFIE